MVSRRAEGDVDRDTCRHPVEETSREGRVREGLANQRLRAVSDQVA